MDDNFENPTFEPDTDEPDFDSGPPWTGTASAVEPPAVGQDTAGSLSQGGRLLRGAVDDYYDKLESRGEMPALGRDTSKFVILGGRLELKAFAGVDIIDARTGEPLSLTTIRGRRGGGDVIRELGFLQTRRTKMPARAVAALRAKNEELDEAGARLESGGIELDVLTAAAQGGGLRPPG